jgi:hypothetical protein
VRKIISKEKEGKKKRRKQFLIGGILILVMVVSVIGYAFNREEQNTSKITYNGFEFIQQSGFWSLSMEDFQFYFSYNPEETGNIDSELKSLNNYEGKPLYIYSENAEAGTEIYRNLLYQNQIVERMQNACPEGEKCDEKIPVKNCTDNFVIIREDNNSRITQNENCVFIQGSRENLPRLSDSFLFKIIGVQ